MGTIDNHSSFDSRSYGFEIFVEPRVTRKWKFPDGTKFEDYRYLEEDEKKEGSTLYWLASIVGMGGEPDNIMEIDYSEKIGIFFKNALTYVCKLNEHLKEVFGEKISLDVTKMKSLEFLK